MASTLLIYGATGYSGRRIVETAATLASMRHGGAAVVLAGRDGPAVHRIAEQHGFDYRVFALDEPSQVRRGVAGATVVLNAAGPFAYTAERLAKSAIAEGCDYVDINGESDVYRRLDDLGRFARQRGTALVSGAGFTAGISGLLLELALRRRLAGVRRLGAVRIGYSAVGELSRGSLAVVWRSMRQQVQVVRPHAGKSGVAALAWVPQGQLQRSFTFRLGAATPPRVATTTAVSLVDTLAALRAIALHGKTVQTIESYIEAGPWRQLALDGGALVAPLAGVASLRAAVRMGLGLLPEGPSRAEQPRPQAVVLQVEDEWRQPLVDWCLPAPNPYDATAPLALAVARALLANRDKRHVGWCTPGPLLADSLDALRALNAPAWRDFKAALGQMAVP